MEDVMATINMLKVLLPVGDGVGPYDLMLHSNGDSSLAWFVVQGLASKNEEPIWVPTPLPRPLADNEEMLKTVADKLFDDGYCFVRAELTVH